MSQLPKSNAGQTSKRKTGAAVAQSHGGALGTEERTVRQRTDRQAAVVRSAPVAAAAAASSSAAPLTANASFMRLAVVERQLIMQLLHIKLLAKVASTCKQLRAEAMHKEAGKFIPVPADPRERDDCRIEIERDPCVKEGRRAHLSPLFRKHMPMRLLFIILATGEPVDLRDVEPLLRKADMFARITEIVIPWDGIIWPESLIVALLTRPCIQRVEEIDLRGASWMRRSRVQAALFALPCLKSIELPYAGPAPLKTALAQAHALTSLRVDLVPAMSRAFRSIRSAPGLTKLSLSNEGPDHDGAPFADVVWCLPSTLQHLTLQACEVSEACASRSLLKAMFLRVPSLQSLNAAWGTRAAPAPLIQGMLDAGAKLLPQLRLVTFNLSNGIDPALLRRFLHRFPQVHAELSLPSYRVPSAAEKTFARTFGGWPRVKLDSTPTENDGPPVVNTDDDVDGPNIEAAVDPGSDDENDER